MPKLPPLAFSYTRFSTPEQARGDSLRRQEQARDAWLAKSGAVLDTSLTLRDEGVSAFTGEHRENPDRHALAAFLEMVSRGRVPKGSYLLIENLDRLSREHVQPALLLVLTLLQSGVRIVQLRPAETVFTDESDAMAVMMMVMELSRGFAESALKSDRVGSAWREKKREAGLARTVLTARCPGWIRPVGRREVGKRVFYDGFELIDKTAAIVRQIVRWATEGHSLTGIVRKLAAAKAAPLGTSKRKPVCWCRASVNRILHSRTLVGEYQPHAGRGGRARRPDGPPIADYYPALITEEQWHALQAAVAGRKGKAGQPGRRRLNIFAHLLKDALGGGSLTVVDKRTRPCGPRMMTYRHAERGGSGVSFPATVFERLILGKLREIKPRAILPDDGGEAEAVLSLTGRVAELDAQLEKVQRKLEEHADLEPLVKAARSLADKRAAAVEALADAQRRAASPTAQAWGEYRTLLDVLDRADDEHDARTRLRSVLRRMVAQMTCLFTAQGQWRLAAVQVDFAGGNRRSYLLVHRPRSRGAAAGQPAVAKVWSFSDALPAVKSLDLRRPAHAERLAKVLANTDPSVWADA
jgi:DNA invertase Pin-like site-specific DNA recombinase